MNRDEVLIVILGVVAVIGWMVFFTQVQIPTVLDYEAKTSTGTVYILLNRTNEECLRDSDTHIRRRGANAYTDSRKAIPKEKGDSATNI